VNKVKRDQEIFKKPEKFLPLVSWSLELSL
jgi:hypothetical protein